MCGRERVCVGKRECVRESMWERECGRECVGERVCGREIECEGERE